MLRGLDHLRDHRHPDPKEPCSIRHATGSAGRHSDPDRITDPPDTRHLVRPVWRAPGVLRHHAVRGRDDSTSGARLRLPDFPAGSFGRRHLRRLVLGRHRLRRQVVPQGKTGHRTGHFRRRQCRCRGHQVGRSHRHGGLRLASGRARVGRGAGSDRNRVLCHDEGRPGPRPPPSLGREAGVVAGHAGAAQERPGLALLALLLLRVRRLRVTRPVAAALPYRRLRHRHRGGWYDRRSLLHSSLCVPRIWRPSCR